MVFVQLDGVCVTVADLCQCPFFVLSRRKSANLPDKKVANVYCRYLDFSPSALHVL